MLSIRCEVNGRQVEATVAPNARLLDLLRGELGLTGTKEGCGEGECGACTVLLNGRPVNSCLVMAAKAEGAHVLTVEGLARADGLHAVQQAFVDHGALQCGYCIPGFLVMAKAFLDEHPRPRRGEIREALSGNLCRCTGYQKIIDAVLDAAERLAERPDEQAVPTLTGGRGEATPRTAR